jgi:hypothetical protein
LPAKLPKEQKEGLFLLFVSQSHSVPNGKNQGMQASFPVSVTLEKNVRTEDECQLTIFNPNLDPVLYEFTG